MYLLQTVLDLVSAFRFARLEVMWASVVAELLKSGLQPLEAIVQHLAALLQQLVVGWGQPNEQNIFFVTNV